MPWHQKELDRTDFIEMSLRYRDNNYTIYVSPEDRKNFWSKFEGVTDGIRILVDRGVKLPPDLKIYLVTDEGKDYQIMTEAIQRSAMYPGGRRIAVIFISSQLNPQITALSACGWAMRTGQMQKCGTRPPVCPCSNKAFGGLAEMMALDLEQGPEVHLSYHELQSKIAITTIHEIGHLLHEINAEELFWSNSRPTKPNSASKVSQYAMKSWKEFVAEVFTAQVLGIDLDSDVMEDYRRLQGPPVPEKRIRTLRKWKRVHLKRQSRV